MRRTKRIIGIISIACLLFISTGNIKQVWAAENNTMVVEGSSYEMKGGSKYSVDEDFLVDSMSFGSKSLGTLNINGKDISRTTYDGKTAYGVTGNISISYTYDNNLKTSEGEEWHIIDDKEKKVLGQKYDSNILSGLLTIEKSYDGKDYENAVNPVCDFLNTTTSGKEIYKTSGDDISKGVYFRITIAYKTERVDGKFLWVDTTEEKRHVEQYEFFVVENSGVISIHNLSVDEELLKCDDYDQELLKHGETLENGSVTRDGFEIEKITESYSVSVQKDSNSAVTARTGSKYTSDGKYTITTTTKLGKKIVTTVYVFKGGTDKGFSTYYGDNLVQAERVFRENDYPTYAKGGRLVINALSDSVPALFGEIKNVSTDKVLLKLNGQRTEHSIALTPGLYTAELYNGDKNKAGSIYKYTFTFEIIDEESAPYVNSNNIYAMEELADLECKHYEVAYQTTLGGYIYVCFSMDSYNEALEYAREIEARFVEKSEDGGFYYKDAENPNRKIKYYDKQELTKASEIYAKQNVEIGYFNPLDPFTYDTYNNDLLTCLENINCRESIKVFPSKEEKEKLISRMPYINNYTFIQASDYDVVSVEAINIETGDKTEIKFDIPVNKQLEKSGEYTIVETNSYGKKKEYNVFFVGECLITETWNIKKDGKEETIDVSSNTINDGVIEIEADSAYVANISNAFDEQSIVTVKAPNVYSFEIKCLASEFKNLEFFKAGDYEIRFIDRLGNYYTVILKITGKLAGTDTEEFNLTYTEFYNSLYSNQKDEREDYTDLEELIAEQIEKEEEFVDEEEINGTNETPIADEASKTDDNIEPIDEIKETSHKGTYIAFMIIGAAIIGGTAYWLKWRNKDSANIDDTTDKEETEDEN